MTNEKAIVAFSGDPITYGHIDIIERAFKVFKHVTVGIGVNPHKKYTFDLHERLRMSERVTAKFGARVTVLSFEGLLVDFAYEQQIGTIVRGVRNSSDVDYEQMLHEVNRSQDLGIDTYVLFADKKLSHVSSSAAKDLQKHNAKNILEYVPLFVKMCLEQTISNQHILGVTGEIGAGKSYVAKNLINTGYDTGIKIHEIDLDILGHRLLEKSEEPFALEARKNIYKLFGEEVLSSLSGFFINPKALGKHLWGNPENLNMFNSIMFEPMLLEYRKKLRNLQGIILLNSALLAEANILSLCNNNVLLVSADKKVRFERLLKRGYSTEEAEKRMGSQLSSEVKKEYILKAIEKESCGSLIEFDNSEEHSDSKKFNSLFLKVCERFGYAKFQKEI
jgi:pantetheine-phosphate adenylyltransferase